MQARNATESQQRVKRAIRKVAKQLHETKLKQKADVITHGGLQVWFKLITYVLCSKLIA